MSNRLYIRGTTAAPLPVSFEAVTQAAVARWGRAATVVRRRPPFHVEVEVQVDPPGGSGFQIDYLRTRTAISTDALPDRWPEVAAWVRALVPDDGRRLVALDAAMTFHVVLLPGMRPADVASAVVDHGTPGWESRDPEVAALLGRGGRSS